MSSIDLYRSVIPGLDALDAALERATTARRNITPPPTTGDITRQLYEQLRAGGDVPSDLAGQLAAASRGVETADRAAGVLTEVINRLRNQRDLLIDQHVDQLLARLRDNLVEVLAAAATATAQLQGARTAQQALDAGGDVAAAWTTLGELAGRYQRIRHEQAALVGRRVAVEDRGQLLREFGEMAGRVDLWPPAERQSTRDTASTPPPWPHSTGGEPTRDRDFLIWLVTHPDARPWLPSITQLEAAQADYHRPPETRQDYTPREVTDKELEIKF